MFLCSLSKYFNLLSNFMYYHQWLYSVIILHCNHLIFKDYLQNLKSHKNKLPSIIIWTTFSWLDRYCVTFCSHIWIWILVIDFLMINSLTFKILMTWRQAFFHDLMHDGHDLSYKLIQGPHFSMWYMSNASELYLSFTLWKIMHHFFGIFGWYTRKCFLFLY